MVGRVPRGMPRRARSIKYCCGSRPAWRAAKSPSCKNRRIRKRNSARAEYSASEICAATRYYIAARYYSPRLRFGTYGQALNSFAECVLRLVMLVAILLVEFVGASSFYIGTDRHAFAASVSCPGFGFFEQEFAGTATSNLFVDDQTIDFGARFYSQET